LPHAVGQFRCGAIERAGYVGIPVDATNLQDTRPGFLGGFVRGVRFRAAYVLQNVGHFNRPVFALAKCFPESGLENTVRQGLKTFFPDRLEDTQSRWAECLPRVDRQLSYPEPN